MVVCLYTCTRCGTDEFYRPANMDLTAVFGCSTRAQAAADAVLSGMESYALGEVNETRSRPATFGRGENVSAGATACGTGIRTPPSTSHIGSALGYT